MLVVRGIAIAASARMGCKLFPVVPGLRFVRRLGSGGMGAVFLAVDETLGDVAVKLIANDRADVSASERFEREIEAGSSIRHANVVRLLRADAIDGVPYAVFERIRGWNLEDLGSQPWPVVVGLGSQLAHAAAAVHDAGWLHRDIKRANVMVGPQGFVTLIDFGLAKRAAEPDRGSDRVDRSSPDLTVRGTIVGTPRYLAPETRRGRPATTATDVYSLGLVLHELLGGGVDRNGDVAPYAAAVPAVIGNLIATALDADPRRRPSARSIAELLDILPARAARPRGPALRETSAWPLDADHRPTWADRRPRLAG